MFVRIGALPLWARGVLAGAVWAVFMFGWSMFRFEDRHLVVHLLTAVVGGVLFGLYTAFLAGRHRRRLFGEERHDLSGREQAVISRALHRGEPVADVRLQASARDTARRFLDAPQRWWPFVLVIVGLTAASGFLAITGPRWSAGLVVFWPAFGGFVAWAHHRQRAAARRYLDATRPRRTVWSTRRVGRRPSTADVPPVGTGA